MREQLVAAARRMVDLGLTRGTSGNVSVRGDDGLLITPSAIPYDRMEAADVVPMAWDGTPTGAGKPSTEWRIHRDVLAARPSVGAVVHAHPPYATALACLGRDIPAFHYMVAVGGGTSIRCAPYATFGTQALSDHALAALDSRDVCLLGNHGILALGADLDSALALALEVETLSEMYVNALQVGEPALLSDEQMAEVLGAFGDYRARS